MDPFRLCLAVGPVAVYLLLLGAVQLSRRPLLVSGGRDAAALALALAGLVIVGPMELFFPFAAAAQLGSQVWLLLLGLYALGVVLTLLLLRPRLVIYNMSADQLRPVLADLVDVMDGDARWAGDSLVLPGLDVQLYLDSFAAFRCVSLVAIGRRQNHQGWRRLETALGNTLAREEVARNPRSLGLIAVSLAMLGWIVWTVSQDPEAIAQSLLNVASSLSKMVGV
ncbi:MAG: hypothetical protein ABFC77_00895 [Thermoguttaceae bacterium]